MAISKLILLLIAICQLLLESLRRGGGPWKIAALLLDRLLVLATIALHASSGIHQLLLAGKERVAVGADFQADVAFVSRAGHEHIAARAVHADFVVSGMNRCLHLPLNLSW